MRDMGFVRSPAKVCAVALSFILVLAGCAHVPGTEDPGGSRAWGSGGETALAIAEPRTHEVVIVVNHNAAWVGSHAGMFAGPRLIDPAGSYVTKRSADEAWLGASLMDYVRFQMADGPWIKLYRFGLSPETFAALESRVLDAGITMPLFCAARVQNLIAGIGPFEDIPRAWWTSPAALARKLDPLTVGPLALGDCAWPNGARCRQEDGSGPVRAAVR